MQHRSEDLFPRGQRQQPQAHSTQPHCTVLRLRLLLFQLLLSEEDKSAWGHTLGQGPRQMGCTGDRRHLIKSSSAHPQKSPWPGCAPGTLAHRRVPRERHMAQHGQLHGDVQKRPSSVKMWWEKDPSLAKEDVGCSWKPCCPSDLG